MTGEIRTLYELKARYEAQLKDPQTHTDYQCVAVIENALDSIEQKLTKSIELIFQQEEMA